MAATTKNMNHTFQTRTNNLIELNSTKFLHISYTKLRIVSTWIRYLQSQKWENEAYHTEHLLSQGDQTQTEASPWAVT